MVLDGWEWPRLSVVSPKSKREPFLESFEMYKNVLIIRKIYYIHENAKERIFPKEWLRIKKEIKMVQ